MAEPLKILTQSEYNELMDKSIDIDTLELITREDIKDICLSFTYTVDAIDGASYGFAINDDGYYESQNKGIPSSYAICRVNLNVKRNCDIAFDVINYAESGWDYAIFGNIDSELALSSSADSNVKQNFRYMHSASIVNVIYEDVTPGNHFIDIKFRKDSANNANNDSVQFKIQNS